MSRSRSRSRLCIPSVGSAFCPALPLRTITSESHHHSSPFRRNTNLHGAAGGGGGGGVTSSGTALHIYIYVNVESLILIKSFVVWCDVMCVCVKGCVCEYDIFWCISLCLFFVFLLGFFLLARGSRVLLWTTVRNSIVTSSWIYRCDEAWHHLSRQGSSPRLEREEDWRVCECNMRMRVHACVYVRLTLSLYVSLSLSMRPCIRACASVCL